MVQRLEHRFKVHYLVPWSTGRVMVEVSWQGKDTKMTYAEFEDSVRHGEIEPDAWVKFGPVTGDAFVRAKDLELFKALYDEREITFRRHFNLNDFPVVTVTVIAASLLVWKLMESAGGSNELAVQINYGAKVNTRIYELGEYWRLVTAAFVHSGLWHLFVNMFVLFHVGGAMENAYGSKSYILLLVFSTITAGIASYLLNPLVSVGASGMVFGVMGASVVFGFKYKELLPSPYKRYFGMAVLPYVLVCLWLGFTDQRIDNYSHLGGLVGGILAALFLKPALLDSGREIRENRGRHRFAYAVLFLVTAGTVAYAAVTGPGLLPMVTPEGITCLAPDTWEVVPEFWGFEARGNGEEWISAGILETDEGIRHAIAKNGPAHAFKTYYIEPLAIDGQVGDLEVIDLAEPAPGKPGYGKLDLVWTYRGERQRVMARVVEHGEELVVVFTGAPLTDYADYRELLEKLAQTCRLPDAVGGDPAKPTHESEIKGSGQLVRSRRTRSTG